MSLDIGAAIRDGASRTGKRNGLQLVVAFAVLGLVNIVLVQSLQSGMFEWAASVNSEAAVEQPATPLALPVPLAVAALVMFLMAFVAEGVRIVAVRTMVSDHTDAVPGAFLRRNIALAVFNGFVAGVVVGVLVAVGSLFLLAPGIFLWISFVFVRQRVAVEDENFIDAMVESWSLAAGNRVELFVIGIVLVAVEVAVVVPLIGLQIGMGPESPVPPLLQTLAQAPVTVFAIAVVSRAYVQLAGGRDTEPADAAEPGNDTDDEEEWPDPPGVDI